MKCDLVIKNSYRLIHHGKYENTRLKQKFKVFLIYGFEKWQK